MLIKFKVICDNTIKLAKYNRVNVALIRRIIVNKIQHTLISIDIQKKLNN